MAEETEPEVVFLKSGQGIGNPNPPYLQETPHVGHKADAESWRRTKNKSYFKKRAKQLVDKGSTEKELHNILQSRRS